jgi:hypothetical protein
MLRLHTSLKEGKNKEGRKDGKKEIKNTTVNFITNARTSYWFSRNFSQSKCGLTEQRVGLPNTTIPLNYSHSTLSLLQAIFWHVHSSFIMSVYASIRTEQLGSHWTNFH